MFRLLLTCGWGKTGSKHIDRTGRGVDLYAIPLLNHMYIMRMFNWPLMVAVVSLFSACGGTAPQQEELQVDQQDTAVQNIRSAATRNIFFNIPSPMETAGMLRKAGAEYDGKVLNDVKNVDKYTSSTAQAINLGIYGADLSYASVFEQTQESMFYSAATRKLADKLNITTAFSDEVLQRMENNMNDRDSLLEIISETYWEMDAYLKENDREHLSALMVAGGWVEGLFIATNVAGANDSPEIRQRIAEQKLSLNDLVALLDTYDRSDPTLNGVRNDLLALQESYASVQVGGGAGEVSQENGVTVIGGGAPSASLSDEAFGAIREKAREIRNKYIN